MVSTRVVSHSEMACFRRCAMEWRFRYGLRRVKRGPAGEALTSGKAVHGVLGAVHRGEPVDVSGLVPALRALVHGYFAYWGTPDRQFACEKTDVPFTISLEGATVVGELDGIGTMRDTGRPVIHEIKTSSEDISVGSAYWQKVTLTDPQVSLYLTARPEKEVLYDVLHKPRLRLKKDESEEAFELRVLEAIMVEPSTYYQRARIVRLEHEHEAHLKDVRGTVHLMQIVDTMATPPRNVDSCFKWNRPCDYFQVCGGGVDIDDENFYEDKRSSSRRSDTEDYSF
jgi:hypothetical protein